jgi:hypothetical protein
LFEWYQHGYLTLVNSANKQVMLWLTSLLRKEKDFSLTVGRLVYKKGTGAVYTYSMGKLNEFTGELCEACETLPCSCDLRRDGVGC